MSVCGQCAIGGEEDVFGTATGTELSAGIIEVFSGEVVNAADFGGFLRMTRGQCGSLHLH
jgi:hypothetical protein